MKKLLYLLWIIPFTLNGQTLDSLIVLEQHTSYEEVVFSLHYTGSADELLETIGVDHRARTRNLPRFQSDTVITSKGITYRFLGGEDLSLFYEWITMEITIPDIQPVSGSTHLIFRFVGFKNNDRTSVVARHGYVRFAKWLNEMIENTPSFSGVGIQPTGE